ncbi:MAG: hypothetical protein U0Y68_23635 [Blastocatellia bacterium]
MSAASKLAPRDRLGQMGLWFVATAVRNSLSGLLAGQLKLTDTRRVVGGLSPGSIFLPADRGPVMVVLSPFIMKLKRGGRNA